VVTTTKHDDTRYWIVVATRDHVQRGVEEGICQVCHGKEGSLRRMSEGDWVVFYSSKERYDGAEKCRKFTAIGKIKNELVYQVRINEDFAPFRRSVEFYPSSEVPIEPLIPLFSFIRNKKSWGYLFKFGLIQIPRQDFLSIASRMLPALQEAV
jgi:predicted RNA-binding protein